jgi:DNA-binding NarL/FixJ family response regulator
MIRVLIFDDNEDRRDSLALLIESVSDFAVSGALSQANNVIEKVAILKPDVVLMDIDMLGTNGIEATRLIHATFPSLPVIIQTVFDDDDKIFQALKAGAAGYLLKNASSKVILSAIREVLHGGAPMTPAIAQRVLTFFRNEKTVKPDYGLTDRETDVLRLLTQGNSYKMIADQLEITFNTVNSHLKKVYEKLQVHSAGEAIAKSVRDQLF